MTWPFEQIKTIVVSMARGAHPDYEEGTGFWIANQGSISGYRLAPSRMRECRPLVGPKGRFKAGDLLIASTGEGVLGKCALAPSDGYCDSHVSIVRCRDLDDARFLHWWVVGHYETINSLCALGATKQTELQREAFLSMPIPMPGRAQRKAIADFLDRECTLIDQRVVALERKKELLRDLKSSVREEWTFGAATSGFRATSSEPWHGELPASWRVERLGNLFREACDLGYSDLPVLSVSIHSGISDKELDDDVLERKVNRSEDRGVYKRVLPGDVVYNQMRAWQGGFGVAKVEGLVSPAYVVARPRKSVSPEFVEHLLRSPRAIEEMRRRSRGITDFRLRLYWDEFKEMVIPYPELPEQRCVASEIDRRLSIVDAEIAVIDQLVCALSEQRKALVSETVTGKLTPASISAPAAKMATP
jgi:type I restriction enzyme, S subunit